MFECMLTIHKDRGYTYAKTVYEQNKHITTNKQINWRTSEIKYGTIIWPLENHIKHEIMHDYGYLLYINYTIININQYLATW